MEEKIKYKEIEKAIREVLVIENPQSIHIAIKKIMEIASLPLVSGKEEKKPLSEESICSLGWKYSTVAKQYIIFENTQKCILVWWKDSNHCELEREDEYDMGYRGTIDDLDDLKHLMKKLEIPVFYPVSDIRKEREV